MQQISAHICERGGGFVEAYSFLAEKKKLFHRFTHRLNVCLFRWITVLPVFNLTHFDRLPAHFRKCSDTQLTRGFCFFSTASPCRRLLALPPPPTPTVHSNSKSNTASLILNLNVNLHYFGI